jgi:hypothetical protein
LACDVPCPGTTARVFPHHDGVCCAFHDDAKVSDSMEPVVWQGGGPRAHVSIYKYVMKSYDLVAVLGSIKSLCFLSLDINMSSRVIAAAVITNFVPPSSQTSSTWHQSFGSFLTKKMRDVSTSVALGRVKESSLMWPMLDHTNYTEWAILMQVTLLTSLYLATPQKRCKRLYLVAISSFCHQITVVARRCNKLRCNKLLQPFPDWCCG